MRLASALVYSCWTLVGTGQCYIMIRQSAFQGQDLVKGQLFKLICNHPENHAGKGHLFRIYITLDKEVVYVSQT